MTNLEPLMKQTSTESTSYDALAKFLHWVIALIVLSMLIFARQLADLNDAERVEMIKFHSGLGLIVLVLMLTRLLWRLGHPPPAPLRTMALWQQRTAASVHYAFYVLLILQPLLGMLLATSVDYSVSPFGIFELSSWISDDPDRAEWLLTLHTANANIISMLALVHIGAALWHHFRKRDNVLRRMLPLLKN
jgi:cytochrome b561